MALRYKTRRAVDCMYCKNTYLNLSKHIDFTYEAYRTLNNQKLRCPLSLFNQLPTAQKNGGGGAIE